LVIVGTDDAPLQDSLMLARRIPVHGLFRSEMQDMG
jgi:hypothetical protein